MLSEDATKHAPSMQTDANTRDKQLLGTDEFRARLHNVIGRNSIYELLAAGRIKHLRVGRKILIPTSELVDFPRRETDGAHL